MSHGTVYACQNSASESPFSRLLPRQDVHYDSHAVALLAGSQGPMMGGSSGKPALPSGFTFFGQFVDHDLTEFRAVENMRQLPLNPEIGGRQRVAPEASPTATNGRSGLFDLDSVYGLLGRVQPELFDSRGMFLLGSETRTHGNTSAPRDIVRNGAFRDGRLIADPRNDENKLILQLHILFMRLHNAVHSLAIGAPPYPVGTPEFTASCESVKACYRRIVLMDYIPRLVGRSELEVVVKALGAKQSYWDGMQRRVKEFSPPGDNQVAMPIEFAQAVFRLGHSQLRARYELSSTSRLPLFRQGGGDLRGREALDANSEVDWSFFFGPTAQPGEPLDTHLPEAIFRLPPPAVDAPPISLAERNIRRGADFGVPSGQTMAVAMRFRYPHIGDPIPPSELGLTEEIVRADASLATQTPLWFYILREAELRNPGGPQLGEVGGLVVAETILGSLAASGVDIAEVLNASPSDAIPASVPDIDAIHSVTGLLKYLGELA